MAGVICAIRGGPDSSPTIEKAIALAGQADLPLFFLYVVNLDFLTHTTSTRVHTISREMHQMGEFILLTAQTQAEAQGVASQRVIRQGNVREEIITLCQEVGADYVVLGRPRGQEEEGAIFTRDLMQEFGEQIERESGARFILVELESE